MSSPRTQFRLGTARGIVLTVSIGLFTILLPHTGSDAGVGLALGVASSLLCRLAMWPASRNEDKYRLAGFLKPVFAPVVELVIAFIIVSLFVHTE